MAAHCTECLKLKGDTPLRFSNAWADGIMADANPIASLPLDQELYGGCSNSHFAVEVFTLSFS
jgi:hypothetical protein